MDFKKNVFTKGRSFLPTALGNLFLAVCLYLIILLYAFSFIYEAVRVDGSCMENLYFDKDIVYYLPGQEVSYGDVVVFQTNDNREFLKRIIAMEGDRINFSITRNQNGKDIYTLTLNGKPLIETYLKDQNANFVTYSNMYLGANSLINRHPECFSESEYTSERKDFVVGKGKFFALGDNRAVSKDSSYYGEFTFSKIEGKVNFYARKDNVPLFELLKQFFWPFA